MCRQPKRLHPGPGNTLGSHPHSLTCTRAGIAWSSDADKLTKALGIQESPGGKRARWDVCVYVCVFVCVCLAGLKWTSGPLLITEPFRGDNTVENGVLVWMEWAGPLMEQRISRGFCFEAACLLTCFWEAGLTKSPRVCDSILCKLLKFCF